MSWAVMGMSQYGLVTTLLHGLHWWPSGFWMQFTILVLNKSLYGASSCYLRNYLPPFRSSQLNSVTYWDFSGVPSLLQCLPHQTSWYGCHTDDRMKGTENLVILPWAGMWAFLQFLCCFMCFADVFPDAYHQFILLLWLLIGMFKF